MSKKNIKIIAFSVVFLASNLFMAFHMPNTVFAATEAEEAAERNADRYLNARCGSNCDEDVMKRVYIAGYLGKKKPSHPDERRYDTAYGDAINERNRDFTETSRQICRVIVNTAQGSDHLGKAYENLKNADKGKAVTACARGFNFGLSDFSRGCQNNYGGRAANDIEFIACLTGNSVADRFIFTSNEARAFAQGSDVSVVGDEDAAAAAEGQGTEETQCEASFFTISWIICAAVEFGARFTQWFFNSFLQPLLEDIPVSLNPSEGSFQAWQGFRLLANIMLVASMLAIVYAQARGDQ